MVTQTIPDSTKKPNNSHNNDKVITMVDANSIQATDGENLSTGRKNLRQWLGQTFRITISDGRILVGFFNCTDKDANVVLSMCAEYLEEGKDARLLGNVMIPGKHIKSISVDLPKDEVFAQDNNKYT